MSRVGKHPISVPQGVDVAVADREVTIKGKLGELSTTVVPEVVVAVENGHIVVRPRDDSPRARAMWGTTRSLINNMVTGVAQGFRVNLEIRGVGYRAASDGKTLTLQVGLSQEIRYPIPQGVTVTCERSTLISVFGPDRQRVGQVAAEIRAFRKPEPYKGKGIRYESEYVRRKEGKKK
ncbi:MAG: 50S ribosomal protein L6 [Alphaproteobacteria bacterium]